MTATAERRILLLSTSFPRHTGDWAGNFVLDLAQALSKRNTVSVLVPGFPGARPRERMGAVDVHRYTYFLPRRTQKVLYPDGIPDQLKKSLLAKLQLPFFMAAFVVQAIRLSRQADLLLCNWALSGVVARCAKCFTRKPYAVVIRGTDMRIMEKGGLFACLFRMCLRRASAICCVAADFVDVLEGMGFEHCFFTPNGVDHAMFGMKREDARRALEWPGDRMVLYVGTLIERKGVATLIDAMAGCEARLVVVGEGDLQDELERQARDRGVAAHFAGVVEREKVPLWFAACDVFVLPSFYEGRPNVLLEALAAGRACVATNIKGTREILADGETGFLVEPGDADALRERITRILADDGLRAGMEERALQSAHEQMPAWEQSAERYGEVFEQMGREK